MKKKYLIILVIISAFAFTSRARAIDEGIYTIRSAVDPSYVIDITGGVIRNSNNVQLYTANNSDAQRFKITKQSDEYYTISNASNSNYSIDVTGSYFKNSTNLQIYKNNNSGSQYWKLQKGSDGYYTIISSNNNYCLDLQGGIAKNSKNIQLYTCNNTYAQKFTFRKEYQGTKTINDGIYSISTVLDDNKYVGINDSGNNIVLKDGLSDNCKWLVNYLGNGYYSIKSYVDVSLALAIPSGRTYPASNVKPYKYANATSQHWIIHLREDGYYNIVSRSSQLLLDLVGGNAVDNNNIQIYEANDSNAQKFKLNEVVEQGEKTIENGTYFINPKLNYNKLVDITGANITDGNNIQIYQGHYGIAQKWYIEYKDDNYYVIYVDYNREYVLDYDNIANVVINKYTNSDTQKWILKKMGSSYYFINKTGMYLDLFGGYTYNSNNIQVHEFNGSDAQKFELRKTVQGISDQVISQGIYMLSSALDNDKVIDLTGGVAVNGYNIQLYQRNGTNAQKWKITYSSQGYYEIASLANLYKNIDVSQAGITPGTNVQLYEKNGSPAQQWLIKSVGDDYYNIVSNIGGNCLSVASNTANNGSNIYVWTCNNSDAQKFRFVKAEKETRVIDISAWNGDIDWAKVANSGIYGVILKAGAWTSEDKNFEKNLAAVKKYNIPYGIYWFSYANTTNGATTELNATKDVLQKYNLNPTLGIYYDLETWRVVQNGVVTDSSYNTSKEMYDNIARIWINGISSMYNDRYSVKIYANLDFYNNRFGSYCRSKMGWIAQWSSTLTYTGPYDLWQYTSTGSVSGITGNVDISYMH